MHRLNLLLTIFLFPVLFCNAQVGINTASPDPSAALDIQSETQGILTSRLNSNDKISINEPAINLLVFDKSEGNYEYNSGSPSDPGWARTLNESYSGTRGPINITSVDYDNSA